MVKIFWKKSSKFFDKYEPVDYNDIENHILENNRRETTVISNYTAVPVRKLNVKFNIQKLIRKFGNIGIFEILVIWKYWNLSNKIINGLCLIKALQINDINLETTL